jgi:hypothetical protein
MALSLEPAVYTVRVGHPHVLREARPPDTPKPRLLDRVREALRTRHYSHRTEEAYIAWIRRYIFFHGKRHPVDLGGPEVTTSSARSRSRATSQPPPRTRR